MSIKQSTHRRDTRRTRTDSLMSIAVLQLNASYEALRIISARRALTMVTKGKALVEVATDRRVCAGIYIPSVIRLIDFARVPHTLQVLSRKNIYLRDGYRCQYCGQQFPVRDLTLDHLIPRAQGGQDAWENLVTACKDDNHAKADRTPEQWLMQGGKVLLRRPRRLTIHTSRSLVRLAGIDNPAWQKYLYFENTTQQQHIA